MNRYVLYLRRYLAAREFGVRFRGTSNTAVPTCVRIAGAERAIRVPDDPAIAHDVINLWLDDEYGLQHVGHEVQSVVDIGANVGLFSLLARHRFPGAIIHAYEPDPEVLEFAKSNLLEAGVTLYGEGVAAADGLGEIVGHGSSRLNQISVVKDNGLPLIGMSTVVARAGGEIDLLKLDCEGFEWDIFRDVKAFSHVRTMRMEYHLIDGRTLHDLDSVTKSLGFRQTHLQVDDGFGIAWYERAASCAA